ncbi:MAG: hypothetical protein R3352_05325 [Salinisphaeraceae bacterium]|nr:hypothetical protein [Salinisphaeraceae bacterium]
MSRKLKPQTPGQNPKAEQQPPQAPAEPPQARKRDPDELPDQSEINPDTIERAVLSKQGWVCPTPKPEPKAMH